MINLNEYKEIFAIESIEERCSRVLEEIQPKLRSIFEQFIRKYSNEDSSLLDYGIHTYETSLRTAITDSKNPTYEKANPLNFFWDGFLIRRNSQ